jgi:uncharacterized membrane protein YhiD involved in acid resistance
MSVIAVAFLAGVVTEFLRHKTPPTPEAPPSQELHEAASANKSMAGEFAAAAVRLPIAAVLGTLLALRPRRQKTPRIPVVVQTQIILAVVGAVIMLVVGASLARAFGIVGVASLVRYRSKIDDPKDAVVMLSALAVGLACGVGLYFLAFFSALFLVGTLWVIESYEPTVRTFDLNVKLGDATMDQRTNIEAILRRFTNDFELRLSSADQASYLVRVPQEFDTAAATEALRALAPDDKAAVEWAEKGKK